MPLSDHRREYLRNAKAQARARARELGLCASCCSGTPRSGLVTCDACMQAARDRRKPKATPVIV